MGLKDETNNKRYTSFSLLQHRMDASLKEIQRVRVLVVCFSGLLFACKKPAQESSSQDFSSTPEARRWMIMRTCGRKKRSTNNQWTFEEACNHLDANWKPKFTVIVAQKKSSQSYSREHLLIMSHLERSSTTRFAILDIMISTCAHKLE